MLKLKKKDKAVNKYRTFNVCKPLIERQLKIEL